MEIRRRVLGEAHPYTLTTMNHLSTTFRYQGRWKEAKELLVEVIQLSSKALSLRREDTLIRRRNLAHTYKSQSRTDEAITMMEEVATICSRHLGQNHLDTYESVQTLSK